MRDKNTKEALKNIIDSVFSAGMEFMVREHNNDWAQAEKKKAIDLIKQNYKEYGNKLIGEDETSWLNDQEEANLINTLSQIDPYIREQIKKGYYNEFRDELRKKNEGEDK